MRAQREPYAPYLELAAGAMDDAQNAVKDVDVPSSLTRDLDDREFLMMTARAA